MAQFISFVGTQVMGTLNPLLGVLNLQTPPEDILLLPTDRTKPQAEKICSLLEAKKELFPDIKVNISPINLIVNVDEISIREDEDVYFNLSGGMSFQVSKFIYQYINKYGEDKLKIVYSERDAIWLLNLKENTYRELFPNVELEPETILTIQNVPFKRMCESRDAIPLKIGDMPHTNPSIPEASRDAIPLKIGDMVFDDVIAVNNYLKLVKIECGYEPKSVKELIAFCGKERKQINELHSFEVIVVTNDERTKERIETESVGNVKVVYEKNFNRDYKKLLKGHDNNQLVQEIRKEVVVSETIKPPKDGPTLYVVLGPEVTNTITAIYTHKCPNLCLIYTPGNIRVEYVLEKIMNGNLSFPFVSGLQFVSTDITGFNLLEMQKFGNGKVISNITPGTKSHSGMLSIWTLRKNGKIYSINNSTKTVDSMDGNEKIPIKDFPLDVLLHLVSEINFIGNKLEMANENMYFNLLNMLGKLKLKKSEGKNIEEKFEKFLDRHLNNYSDNTIRNIGHKFEILVAMAFRKIGCEQIRTNVKIKWENKKDFYRGYLDNERKTHLIKTEIDVIGIYKKKILTISVKAQKKKNMDSLTVLTNEIKAQSEFLGRMSLPILVSLYHQGPACSMNDVLIIGWETLCDEDELRKSLDRFIDEKMTTKK